MEHTHEIKNTYACSEPLVGGIQLPRPTRGRRHLRAAAQAQHGLGVLVKAACRLEKALDDLAELRGIRDGLMRQLRQMEDYRANDHAAWAEQVQRGDKLAAELRDLRDKVATTWRVPTKGMRFKVLPSVIGSQYWTSHSGYIKTEELGVKAFECEGMNLVYPMDKPPELAAAIKVGDVNLIIEAAHLELVS